MKVILLDISIVFHVEKSSAIQFICRIENDEYFVYFGAACAAHCKICRRSGGGKCDAGIGLDNKCEDGYVRNNRTQLCDGQYHEYFYINTM